jgi:hypothetical protein
MVEMKSKNDELEVVYFTKFFDELKEQWGQLYLLDEDTLDSYLPLITKNDLEKAVDDIFQEFVKLKNATEKLINEFVEVYKATRK